MIQRLLLIPLLLLITCSATFAIDGTLLVVNRDGKSVSFIDLQSGKEVAQVPTGQVVPHEVAVSPDGTMALTTEFGGGDDRGQEVILIDVASASILGRIDLGPDSRPHTALFLPDGRHAVVTMQDSDKIATLDLDQMSIVRTYPTGGREGHMMRLSPDGSRAYVTSRGAEGTLSVIFLDEEREPLVIPTGLGAEGLDVTPDGSEIWVSNRRDESISIIDAEMLEVVAKIDSRPFAGRIDIGPGGRAIVPNGGGGSLLPQYLRIYDVQTREMVTEAPIRDGTPQAGNFGVLIQDGMAYVSDPYEGTLQVFNLDDLSDREVLATGHEAPDGLAWSPLRLDR